MTARFLSMELAEAAYKLVKDVLKVREGETVVITTDTTSEWEVAEAGSRGRSDSRGENL